MSRDITTVTNRFVTWAPNSEASGDRGIDGDIETEHSAGGWENVSEGRAVAMDGHQISFLLSPHFPNDWAGSAPFGLRLESARPLSLRTNLRANLEPLGSAQGSELVEGQGGEAPRRNLSWHGVPAQVLSPICPGNSGGEQVSWLRPGAAQNCNTLEEERICSIRHSHPESYCFVPTMNWRILVGFPQSAPRSQLRIYRFTIPLSTGKALGMGIGAGDRGLCNVDLPFHHVTL
jgi:hypothetical protein